MEKPVNMNSQEAKIQGLLDRYLASRPAAITSTEAHLDQDTLAAFTEGSLSEREAAPLVLHLADCSFCRHISAELVRLDLELSSDSEQSVTVQATSTEPAKISEVLSGLFAKIFGTNDSAVFAHEEKKEEKEGKEDENIS
jgi:hypothetical protein